MLISMEFSVAIGNSLVHGIRFGVGDELLICFHGFGEDADKFRLLEPSLGSRFTIISIDLPFHGKTEWTDDLFDIDDLRLLILDILNKEKKTRFSLMGYSLGGKLIFSALEQFPSQIDKVILIAPDGVRHNAWYDVAVYPWWGQALFRKFVNKPGFIFSIARMLRSFGAIGKRLFNFLKVQTDSEVKRQKVYDVWMATRNLKTSPQRIKLILNTNAIKSYIFIGKYDRVITTKIGSKFSQGLKYNNLIVLDKGHNLITDSLNQHLKNILEL